MATVMMDTTITATKTDGHKPSQWRPQQYRETWT